MIDALAFCAYVEKRFENTNVQVKFCLHTWALGQTQRFVVYKGDETLLQLNVYDDAGMCVYINETWRNRKNLASVKRTIRKLSATEPKRYTWNDLIEDVGTALNFDPTWATYIQEGRLMR